MLNFDSEIRIQSTIVRSIMWRRNPNLVIGWDLFVDAQASEGMSTALNCTACIYGFEFQVSKPTASTLVTVSWFIPVLGRYQTFLELLDSVMTKKLNKDLVLSKFLNYFLQHCDRLYIFILFFFYFKLTCSHKFDISLLSFSQNHKILIST
jgi:hypothetical protein